MPGADGKLDLSGPQDRHGLADTSNALINALGFDVSTSFASGDHSQSLEWQTTRESPVMVAPSPWASWSDGRGAPSYARAGGWYVSLKQAQNGTEKIKDGQLSARPRRRSNQGKGLQRLSPLTLGMVHP
jgi:hypothetical protein